MPAPARTPLEPGFCILHGNHLEDLTQVLVEWVRAYPLDPLEDEVFLVQSNGMAQWLKLAQADDDACGIAAGQDFRMPARFLWQAYRSVLGAGAVPETSPFDKSRLLWRLMARLPGLLEHPEFAPLQRFLRDEADARKRYQLAERLADLYDQYQVYRADWLGAWEAGDDRIFRKREDDGVDLGGIDSAWQAMLWRDLLDAVPAEYAASSRAHVHRRFLETLEQGGHAPGLPARVVVFGLSSLPGQVLEALHALSPHCQILMMVQNPCRHYWGDIIEDKELLRREGVRHQPKADLAAIPADEQHRHANPLLAAWGKQGRDYIGMLYDYDVPEAYDAWFRQLDLFADADAHHHAPGSTLAAIQQAILDLEPAPAEPRSRPADASVQFHLAHSAQREVEVLHDRLLDAIETDAEQGQALRPRDIIVMVPDIEAYAPHIDAVFGNVAETDPRYIPYTIADRSHLQSEPLTAALQQLLDLPRLRFTPGDLLDLLEAPALRRCFGIDAADLPTLHAWVDGAGIRWGLHGEQRATFDLPSDFEQNSWWFGLRRMLLGYAVGDGAAWHGIEPYSEVGGLEAGLAGRLVALVDALERHWRILSTPAVPAEWVARLSALLDELFVIDTENDIRIQAALIDTLEAWESACAEAGFDEALPLAVAREAWLGALEQASLSQRFLAGRVNFCTLMPMRSIPFRQVCLLGMNDGDYPRSHPPQDFDLMARPGQYRPGDRSRRDDDRYLFLEAVLAARECLYISWVGRDIRDNEHRPPSVLVAQLRDYIAACWQAEAHGDQSVHPMLDCITCEHPLQPFSRRYFEHDGAGGTGPLGGLFTYAEEWRSAHESSATGDASDASLPLPALDTPMRLTPGAIARLLKDPPGHFLRRRLKVEFPESEGAAEDSEPFCVAGLGRYQVEHELISALTRASAEDQQAVLGEACARLRRAGWLPVEPFGEQYLADLRETADAAAGAWHTLQAQYPHRLPRCELEWSTRVQDVPVMVEHWLDGLLGDADDHRLHLRIVAGKTKDRPDKCRELWVEHLLACACGHPLESRLLAGDVCHVLAPLDAEAAGQQLETLIDAWLTGLCQPLPLALRTGFAFAGEMVSSGDADKARAEASKAFTSNPPHKTGEVDYDSNTALRRAYPEFRALLAARDAGDRGFTDWAGTLYQPLVEHRREEPLP